MAELLKLVSKDAVEVVEVRKQAIAILEEVLKETKAGKFNSVIVLASMEDGTWATRTSAFIDVFRAIGYLEQLKHLMLQPDDED